MGVEALSNRRRLLALGLAGVWVGAAGMTRQELTAAQKKLIDHYTNNDPVWSLLATAAVTEDRDKGLFKASFPSGVAAMKNRALTVTGFITPLDTKARTRHFVLTRRSTTCPFCPPNAPTEAIEVMTDAPVAVSDQEVSVTGRLVLLDSSAAGLFYGLAHAACTPSARSVALASARSTP